MHRKGLRGEGRPHRSITVSERRIDENGNDAIILASSDVATDSDSGSESGRSNKLSGRIYLDFQDLFEAAGTESEEDFVVGLATLRYSSIRIVDNSVTSQDDADFVFNNVSMRIVRNTRDIEV